MGTSRLHPCSFIITAALLVAACSYDDSSGPAKLSVPAGWTAAVLPGIQPSDSASVDRLARAFSSALREPAVRAQLLAAFRSSGYTKHALPLASYSQTPRGSELLSAVSRVSGMDRRTIDSLVAIRGGLVLWMQSVNDRLHWRASDVVGVEGSALTTSEHFAQRKSAFAYMPNGEVRNVPLSEAPSFAVVVLGPREEWLAAAPTMFPGEPGAISSRREEAFRTLKSGSAGSVAADVSTDCDPNGTAIIPPECQDGTGSGPSGVYLPSSFTMSQCHPAGGFSDPSQDADQNGILDQCEAELAFAFHPQLQFDQGEGPVCPTQEPYWTTKFQNSWFDGRPVIRIFYALSYHEDCGSPNPACPFDCDGHSGDSEFIIEEVTTAGYPTYDGPHWFLDFVTYSAHYGSNADGTATYSEADVEYANAAPGSNPVSWVALWKHSNYRSQAVCDAGAYYFDTCDHPGQRVGLESAAWMNLGSRNHPLIDGVGSRQGWPGFEHYWTQALFCGWDTRGCSLAATAYSQLMSDWGF